MTATTGRRNVLKGAAALGLAAAGTMPPLRFAIGAEAKLKLGLMLPYSGTYAQLGKNIDAALRLAIAEQGGRLGGRAVEYVTLDDQSDPAKAADNANRLVTRDKVDFLIGSVHSGVVLAMVKVARDHDSMLIIPNAGAAAATGSLCAPNIFRTSFTNWQPAYPMGKLLGSRDIIRAATVTWDYDAGHESVAGFKEGYASVGGKVVKEFTVPFPTVEFQAILTEIAALKPDAVYAFFAGDGAVKFVRDYAAAGLRNHIPLFGPGFLTDGTLEAQGDAAQGIETTLHYGDGLLTPKDNAFRYAFRNATGREADVYAVQGYDTGQLLASGLAVVRGDTGARSGLVAAMEIAHIDSPRGAFVFSKAHNPIQDIYLRKVQNRRNQVTGTVVAALADPARGCKMVAAEAPTNKTDEVRG